jgi:ribosome maturation factor RimP
VVKIVIGDGMVFREVNDQDIALVEGLLTDYPQYKVVDVRIIVHTGMVEVVISKEPECVSIEDCTLVSGILDLSEVFRGRFGSEARLSVCSPGLDRKLTTRREMRLFSGREIEVTWLDVDNRPQSLIGKLAAYSEGEVKVSLDDKVMKIREQDIRHINLYFNINTEG